MRETIQFKVEEIGEIEIYAEPIFLEDKKIEGIMSEMYGGLIPFEEFRCQLSGLRKELTPAIEENRILENAYGLAVLMTCRANLDRVRIYAVIKICGVKVPEKFYEITTEKLDEVVSAYEVALTDFFREVKKRKAASVN